jgi:hypothetical protein
LIVVEDAAYRRAIIEHHILRGLICLDSVRWEGLAWRREYIPPDLVVKT